MATPAAAGTQAPTGPTEAGIDPSRLVGTGEATFYASLVLALGGLLLYMLVEIWPAVPHEGTTATSTTHVTLFGKALEYDISTETALLLIVVFSGAAGSCVHVARSLGDYIGNRRLARSWIPWYALRLFWGPALALAFYFAVRGGFLSGTTSDEDVNPFGVAALAAFVGLFSKQAGNKLHQVFDALFQTDPKYDDSSLGDSLQNPAPVIAGIEPKTATVGTTELDFVITGHGFAENSEVRVTRTLGAETEISSRTTTFVSASELKVALHAKDVEEPGTLHVTVMNPAPGGGVSGPYTLDITDELESDEEIDVPATTEADAAATTADVAPTLAEADPPTLAVATSELTITLIGERLTGATATVATAAEPDSRKDRAVEPVDDNRLLLTLDPADVAEPGALTIEVTTPAGTAPFEVQVVPGGE